MPIDATIIGKLNHPQMDVLGTVGKAQGVAQGMLQNRLLGQEIGGKEALGRAITASTDPATGQTNFQDAMGRLAQDPQGAFATPGFAAQVQEREGKGLANQTAALGLAEKRWEKVGDTMVSLLGTKEPLTKDSVIGALKRDLVSSGMFNDPKSAEDLTTFVAGLPDDDAGLRKELQRLGIQSKATLDRIQTIKGPVSTVDTGANVVQQQISPLTGDVNTIGAVGKERTPTERAALVPKYDAATGKTTMVRSGEIMGDDPSGQKPVALQSAPVLGEAEAAAGGVQQAQALRVAADKVPEQQAALKNIRDQVANFAPGAKADYIGGVKALAVQLGVASPQVRDQVAAQQEFNKLATMFINQQVGALGGTGTDSKLESAAKGSPNEFMSKEGIKDVTSLMMGLNDATSAKNTAWQTWLNSGKSPASYGQFQTQFNQIYNPRVFQSVYMDEKQRQNMLGNMTPTERKQFQSDWTTAKRFGWIK